MIEILVAEIVTEFAVITNLSCNSFDNFANYTK